MLTDKQERFARCIALEGMTQTDAYRECYNVENMSDNAIYVDACRLAQNPKISLRINELRMEMAKPSIMSAQERLEWLTTVIKDAELSVRDRLSASDQMNKMQGQYVQKIEATVDSVNINVELVEEE